MRQSRVVQRGQGARTSGPDSPGPCLNFEHLPPHVSKPLTTSTPLTVRGVAYRFAHPPSAETTLVWVVDGRKAMGLEGRS